MMGHQIGVYLHEQLFEGDSSVLVLVEEVVERCSYTFHVIVLLLTE